MNIMKIYSQYGIPEKLQMHMLRVAACAQILLEHWKGPEIEEESIIRVLLLHDMGNLVKIPESEFPDDNKFITNRRKQIAIYGEDDHAISEGIAKEVGLTEREIFIMNQKVFCNNEKTVMSPSWEIKIGAYCDQRVEPDGIYPIKERLEKAKQRYVHKPGSSMNCEKTDTWIQCATKIEKQIMENTDISPEQINNETIAPYIEKLKRYEIEKRA